MSREARGRSDRGDTLIEVLIAIVIIGLTATAVLGGFATSIASSAEHRQFSSIDTALRSYASAATYELQQQPNPGFTQCASPLSYQIVSAYPSGAAPGSQIEVFGTGFTPNASVSIKLGGTSLTTDITAGKTSAANGSVAAVVDLPSTGLSTGSDPLTVSTGATTGTGAFSVATGTAVTSDLAGYSLSLSSIQYYSGSSFTSSCTQAGNAPQLLTVQAQTVGVRTDSLSFVVINPEYFSSTVPVFDSTAASSFTIGSAGSFTVRASGLPTPTLTESGTLPSGVTFVDNHNGSATIAGTPASGTSGTYDLTLTASNGDLPNATQSFTLSVDGPPSITSASSTTFIAGTAGSFTVTTSAVPTATLSENGSLPSGVTFTDNGDGTATIAGSPAATSLGVFTFTITAGNGIAPNATQTFKLTVDGAPAITSANTYTFAVGTPGTFMVTTTGFPLATLSETPALPGTLSFTNNGNGTATIAGTPSAGSGGSYTITITASNGVGTNATQTFTLVIDQAPTFTSSANPAAFTKGKAGSFMITTSGFPNASVTNSTSLPSGFTFTQGAGGTATISWTKQAATGTLSLNLSAANGILPNAAQTLKLVWQ